MFREFLNEFVNIFKFANTLCNWLKALILVRGVFSSWLAIDKNSSFLTSFSFWISISVFVPSPNLIFPFSI